MLWVSLFLMLSNKYFDLHSQTSGVEFRTKNLLYLLSVKVGLWRSSFLKAQFIFAKSSEYKIGVVQNRIKQTSVVQKLYPFPSSNIHCGYVTGIFKTPVHLEPSQMYNVLACAWLTSKSMYPYCHQNTEGARAKIQVRSNVR